MLCCASFVMTACNSQKYSYQDFKTAYTSYLEMYSDTNNAVALFDSSATHNVQVRFSNTKLEEVIQNPAYKDIMYTRLTHDLNSNQAIFEPALYANFACVNNFYQIEPVKHIPSDVSTDLYNNFIQVQNVTQEFVVQITKFNDITEFETDPTALLCKTTLEKTIDVYYQLVCQSAQFAQKFLGILDSYVFEKKITAVEDCSDKVDSLFVKRLYLQSLAKMSIQYVDCELGIIYKKVLVHEGMDKYTDTFAGDLTQRLNSTIANYKNVSSKLVLGEFANSTTISVVNDAKNYLKIFETTTNLASTYYDYYTDIESSGVEYDYVDKYYKTEFANMGIMLSNIALQILK